MVYRNPMSFLYQINFSELIHDPVQNVHSIFYHLLACLNIIGFILYQ